MKALYVWRGAEARGCGARLESLEILTLWEGSVARCCEWGWFGYW
ncbi:MAG: hypothetical protein AAGG57_13310 [Pseudomonadota bacterium]